MKNPSIRITKNLLKQTLNKFNVDIDFENFFNFLINNQNHRILIQEKQQKPDVDFFNLVLFQKRLDLKHKGVSIISKNDSAYKLLLEITQLAIDFSDAYNLSYSQGFKTYIDIGFNLIKNYSLNRFKFYNQNIFKVYSELLCIREDTNKNLTESLISIYLKHLGVSNFLYNRYDFVLTSSLITNENIKPEKFIEAQFKEFEFLGTIPEPNQLHTDNALKRYQKYMLNNRKSIQIVKANISEKPTVNDGFDNERRLQIQKILSNENNSK